MPKQYSNSRAQTLALRFSQLLVIFLIFLGIDKAHSAVPETINYQGFLADDSGVPIDATHDITFRIYNASSGGLALYTSTQSIPIADGRFNTELGGSPSFPANLFDGTPLFLSLEIDSDGEMSPRQPLSSTPFAHKANDADTVGGLTAASLDQSAHVSDTDNPHEVNATQVGAASLNDLSSHATSESVHHFRYSNSEAVTAMGAVSNSNTLNHNRFTSSNAVSAMGAKDDANALNHDRFTVSDVLAADGSGSTLDADLLDGMDSSVIIDAAGDEVRTPISQSDLPLTIIASGSYYFTENLAHSDVNSNAINVNADHVTIDMMGFILSGPGQLSGLSNGGINIQGRNNVTILNGTVREFGYIGIQHFGSGVKFCRVIDVRVVSNGNYGIYLSGSNSEVRGVIAQSNGLSNAGDGIYAGRAAILIGNSAGFNSGQGIGAGDGSTLINNTAYNNQDGAGIYSGSSSTLTNNTAYDNQGDYGFRTQSGSTLTNNAAYNNQGEYGILTGPESNLFNNSSSNNEKIGIYSGSGSTVLNNTANQNGHWGLYGEGENLITGNSISSNNTSDTANKGGLRVGESSLISANNLVKNKQIGVEVFESKSVLKNNHITDSPIGIKFNESRNGYKSNTLVSNGTSIDGTANDLGDNDIF